MVLAGGSAGVRGGGLVAGIATQICALLLWSGAYHTGLAPWLGFVDKIYSNIAAGPVTVAGRGESGMALGPKTFFFLAGQDVVVDYEVEIRRGALLIRVFEFSRLDHALYREIAVSGSDTEAVRLDRAGLYSIELEPTVGGGAGAGFDIDLSARWGAR
ncbi:MAG: hypothetical protein HKM95_08905 [Inquilinus sp.]|nr:hypothetical protein [Inquilinus sp.]